MSEYHKPYFPRYRYAADNLVGVVEADGVQPAAADIDWRVMQAHHHVIRIGRLDFSVQACEFGRRDVAARLPGHTAVQADDQPVRTRDGFAVMKFRRIQRLAHERAYIVIARQRVDRQVESAEQFDEMLIGAGAVILDDIAGHQRNVGTPFTGAVIIEDRR